VTNRPDSTAASLRNRHGRRLHFACVDGVAVLSWSPRVGDVSGEITTIEGLGSPEAMHAAQAARTCATDFRPADCPEALVPENSGYVIGKTVL
jgi:hypothetical protein